MYSCRFNIVSSSDTVQEILLHFCTIQLRHSIYTKEEKPHDKTTSNKLGEVVLRYHRNIQFSTRFLYTHTSYMLNFISIYLLSLPPLLSYNWIHILYFTSFCSNHVDDIAYFLRHCQLYVKTLCVTASRWPYEKSRSLSLLWFLIIF